jgi:sulfide:quinone oxidoreductase
MQVTQLDALTYVGPQITFADMAGLAGLGVKTIIVARPEGEDGDQPEISTIRNAAEDYDIVVHQIPVVPGCLADDQVLTFGTIKSAVDHPVFAYCRSGMRATSLWALNAAARGGSIDDILLAAGNANYDLRPLAPRLSASAA